MKVLVCSDQLPNKSHSTVTYMNLVLTKHLINKGHDVFFAAINSNKKFFLDRNKIDKNIKNSFFFKNFYWRQKKYNYFLLIVKRIFRYNLADFFPRLKNLKVFEKVLKWSRPDLIIIWGSHDIIFGFNMININLNAAIVADSPDLTVKYKRTFLNENFFIKIIFYIYFYFIYSIKIKLLIKNNLKKVKKIFFTSNYEDKKFKSLGLKNSQFIRNLVPDLGFAKNLKKNNKLKKFKILMFGNMHGTATLAGLKYFNDKIFHKLTSTGEDFEVSICGKVSKKALEILTISREKNVFLRGFVKDLKKAISQADVVLVPTPIVLGIRVRIVYAWTIGACVIAHEANQRGMNDLIDGYNCILGKNSDDLVSKIILIKNNFFLKKKIIINARKYYEKNFNNDSWFSKFSKELNL